MTNRCAADRGARSGRTTGADPRRRSVERQRGLSSIVATVIST